MIIQSRGSAIAKVIGENVMRHGSIFDKVVRMWVHEERLDEGLLSEIINARHENIKYLKGIKLPENVLAVPDLVQAAEEASILVFVLPHQFVKRACQTLKGRVSDSAKAISLIKVLEPR